MFGHLKNRLRRWLQGQKFDLAYILQSADPRAPYEDRVAWIERLIDWVRYQSAGPAGEGGATVSTRIRFVIRLLDRHPEWKRNSAALIRSVLQETRTLRSFTELGLPTESTFFREILRRFFHVVLPHALEDRSLERLFLQVLYDEDDPVWIDALSSETRAEIRTWVRAGIDDSEPLLPTWIRQASEAMVILSARISGICFLQEIRDRAPEFSISSHPALQLQGLCRKLHEGFAQNPTWLASDLEALRREFHSHVQSIRALMLSVRSHMEEQGLSLDLVYQVDRVKLSLERIEILDRWLMNSAASERRDGFLDSGTELVRALAWGSLYDSDFAFVLKKGTSLLSRKIVERTGATGEHFITQTPSEWRKMFLMAAGGGALTAGTAFFKYVVNASGWPPFIQMLYHSTNYSLSFVVMHYLGFKLATKQPSMTAAALAGKLRNGDDTASDDIFVEEMVRISRSQFAAVMGNVLVVIPFALAVDVLCRLLRQGEHFLPVEKAVHVVHSIHPWHTATLLFAAWTGVLLWLSSMIAGWCENAVVFFDLPKILLQQRGLKKVFGEERLRRMSQGLIKHTSGVAGSVSLGVLLALSPMIGEFFGLPTDVRHVTLTTGSLAYAWSSLGVSASEETFKALAICALSVGVIGLLNFGISFFMAVLVAFRAQEVGFRRFLRILRQVLERFRSTPFQFFFPRGEKSRRS